MINSEQAGQNALQGGAKAKKDTKRSFRISTADLVNGGIIVASLMMFVGTGSSVLQDSINILTGAEVDSDKRLVAAFILNIALIMFVWRRYIDLGREVKNRAQAEALATSLAETDHLTGFLNRRALHKNTIDLIKDAQSRENDVAFMMLDLDNFKNINDMHGHAAGDQVLKQVAKRLVKTLPDHALLARFGGDEFACVMSFDPHRPQVVERLAEDIVEKIAVPISNNAVHLTVTTSLGIAKVNAGDHNRDSEEEGDEDRFEAITRHADIAMYAAKKQGRNRYCWFDSSMESELRTRNTLETEMRKGIPEGQFVPYYEQQVDLQTGKLAGFEVLARWHSPQMGLISPEIFIAVAESAGLIGDLSMSILRQALLDGKSWDQNITLSVNISPVQLLDPWLAQKLVKLLVETGFPPERLEIEITESSLFENLNLAKSTISSLKNQGISLALDDFGTGYSSLAHLRALPFDRIKIDRSFVSSIVDNSESRAIVSAIASLGEALDLAVVAEGIEDEETREIVTELGCAKGQGFHFSRPLPIQKAELLMGIATDTKDAEMDDEIVAEESAPEEEKFQKQA